MHAENAFIGNPSVVFSFKKFLYTVISDELQIFDFTHTVACSIAFIEVFQPVAGKLITAEAVFIVTLKAGP